MAPVPRSRLALLVLWGAATAANLTKAVHIDDPTYLLIARHILEDPLHPMSGTIVLSGAATPISEINQPSLLLYGFAGVMAAFGSSELALHLFIALFTGVAIVAFHALARHVCPRHALALTAALALGPAFLPGQNLMTDVPLVAAWILFFWILVTGVEGPSPGRAYAAAAVVAGLACLVKYTSLVLLPALAIPILVHRDWRRVAVLGIPLLMLGAWSLFNVLDYGEVHVLGRDSSVPGPAELATRLADFVLCLGAVSPFSVLLLPWAWQRPRAAAGMALATAAAFVLHLLLESATLEPVLAAAFFANGVLVLLAVGPSLRSAPQALGLLLAGWIAGAAAFIVLFAPFMAVRHVLLVVPPVLLGLGRLVPPVGGRPWLGAAVTASALLGGVLAVSDWILADLYRQQARSLRERLGAEARLFYVGNWGWRWYAEAEGMEPYLPGVSPLGGGDLLVVPETPSGLRGLHSRDAGRVETLYEFTVQPTLATRLRTASPHPMGGYYAFRRPGLPWYPSRRPLERFRILRVRGP